MIRVQLGLITEFMETTIKIILISKKYIYKVTDCLGAFCSG